MKKVIKQLGQLIFKHRKKLIYGALAFFVGQICFFNFGGIGIENEVYASNTDTPTQNAKFQEEATKWYEKLSFYQQSIYVILYPLLVVAGKLVDNSFVYGEVFGFDVVLWQLWNIVKNLANFGLGFLLVYKIFEYLIKGDKQVDMKKIILSALIAGVGIQASWFIMAALIDVSTVLTYGVGGLPISILKENSGEVTDENLKYNPYMMKTAIYFDLPNNLLYDYVTNAQTGDKQSGEFYISECETFSYKDSGVSESLILAPQMIYYLDDKKNVIQTVSDKCHLGPQDVYYFSSLYVTFPSCSDYKSCRDAQIEYKASLDKAKSEIIEHKSKGEVEGLIQSAVILQKGDAHSAVEGPLWSVIYSESQHYGKDVDNKWTGEGGNTSRLQDVLSDNSYVGVFTALYSSLLSMGKGLIPTDAGIFPALLNAALSLGHVLAVGIPLIAVALVFMMRVGILWMAIALYFLGFTILKTNVVTSINTASEKGAKATILNTIIQGGTTIVFAIEMLVLCILALMRLIYLWMFIVLSPLAVLLWCIDKANKKTSGGDGKGFLSKFTNQISFRSFFINVFKPTIIVLGFGIAVIFVSLMNKVILDNVGKEFDIRGTKISSDMESTTNTGNDGDKTYTTKMDTNLLSFIMAGAGKTILEIVLCIVTVMIVYLIISLAVKMGGSKDFVSKKISKLQEGLGDFMTSIPVVPVVGYDKNGQRISSSISVSGLLDLPGKKIGAMKGYQEKDSSDQTASIMEMWGLKDDNHLTQSQKTGITNAGSTSVGKARLEAKLSYIEDPNNKIKSEDGKGMILSPIASDKFWIQEFTNWLNETKEQDVTDLEWKNMLKDWKDQDRNNEKNRTLEKLFTEKGGVHVKTYVKFFKLDNSIDSWGKLQEADISKMD